MSLPSQHRQLPYLLAVGWLILVASTLGCGPAGDPNRIIVLGTVSYDGQPVPSGRIIVEPNFAAGGTGPADYAWIESGRFETPKGVHKGPVIVTVEGYEAKPIEKIVNDDLVEIKTYLFQGFTVNDEIQPDQKQIDIVVPGGYVSR